MSSYNYRSSQRPPSGSSSSRDYYSKYTTTGTGTTSSYTSKYATTPSTSAYSSTYSRTHGLDTERPVVRTSSRYTTSSDYGLSRLSLTDSISSRYRRQLPPLESSIGSHSYTSSIYPSSGSSELRSSRSTSIGRAATSTLGSRRDYNNNTDVSSSSNCKKQGGLRNIGNSCYLNSVLQCLLHCEPLRSYIVNGTFKREIQSKSKTRGKLATETNRLFTDLLDGQTGDPRLVKSQVNAFSGLFRGTAQEDAQEFLRWYLEGLHEDVQRVTSKPRITEEATSAHMAWRQYTSRESSAIVDKCVGQLKSSLTCDHCGYVSKVWDPFWDLSVPIPRSATSINDCLLEFQREEILDGSEKPKCEQCKTRRKMRKKFEIEKAPQVLVIHLKRFGDATGWSRSKITADIKFPVDFNLERQSYSLRAVCNHSGGVGGGHYIAYGKTDDGWFEYNDSMVSRINESRIQSRDAYLLFYTAK